MNRNKLATLLSLAFVTAILIKVLFFSYIFSSNFIFDEVYYVTASRYIYHLLGLYPEFHKPIEANITKSGNTIIIEASANSLPVLNIGLSSYNWINIEHPILGKLIIGALLLATGDNLVLVRIILLACSLLVLFFFSRKVVLKYGSMSLVGMAIVALFDWVYYHFTYLAVLDTLMIASLLVTLYFLIDERYLTSVAFMSLSVAFKEVAMVFAVGVFLYMTLRRKWKKSLMFLLVPLVALLASYGANAVFTDLRTVLNALTGLTLVLDPFACTNLCLLPLEYVWGIFKLYTPLVWIYFVGVLCLALKESKKGSLSDAEYIPYFMAFVYILFLAVVALKRAIYPFYYAPLIAMLPTITSSFTIVVDCCLHEKS